MPISKISACVSAMALTLSLSAHALAQTQAPSENAIAPSFEKEPTPAEGSPNVIYIVLDDTGFADLGCYGSEISTPNMDKLASRGLRFNNFHTRAICSPTRAALLTGRNSHTVGVANVTNMLSGFSHGQGRITHAAATIAEMLQSSGYRTFALGKWHLSPMQLTDSRDQWPLGRGFDQYYGFLDGMTDQFHPDLVLDNSPIDPQHSPGYHLSADLVDKAISYISSEKAASPDRPFFMYLAFGATHAPHQVPESYIQKYLPVYGSGWDEIRAKRFARQKALGIIPAGAELAPRNPDVKAWNDLTPKQKAVNVRFEAAFAGFLEHTDQQIGRLVDYLGEAGQLSNTIIVLLSDNGGSVEGHESGTFNEVSSLNQVHETEDALFAAKDRIGTEFSYPNYPSGWAQVSNTPFKFYKTTVWDGGTRDPLIIAGPAGFKDAGAIRSQFVDVIDVTPTILDIVSQNAPETYKGVAQIPLAGASLKSVLSDAKAPAPRDTQYFELIGQRAIWHDGWQAISEHRPGTDFESDVWHLYDMRKDFSGLRDLAAKNPQKLKAMQDLWWSQARQYGALPLFNAPLLDSFTSDSVKANIVKYKTMRDPKREYVFYPRKENLLRQDAPQIGAGSFLIDATLDLKNNNPNGVVIADGDRFGGYSLFAKDGIVTFEVSDLGTTSSIHSDRPLTRDTRELRVAFERGDTRGGLAKIYFDGVEVASGPIARRETQLTSASGFSVGYDTSGPVSESYGRSDGFPFGVGELRKVVVRKTK